MKDAVQGLNTDVPYQARVYHIQTEDSGLGNPHIITHLYFEGTIIDSKKTSYSDILKVDRLQEVVKELMKEQHKAMIKNLLSGLYDRQFKAADRPKQNDPSETERSLDQIIFDYLAESKKKV